MCSRSGVSVRAQGTQTCRSCLPGIWCEHLRSSFLCSSCSKQCAARSSPEQPAPGVGPLVWARQRSSLPGRCCTSQSALHSAVPALSNSLKPTKTQTAHWLERDAAVRSMLYIAAHGSTTLGVSLPAIQNKLTPHQALWCAVRKVSLSGGDTRTVQLLPCADSWECSQQHTTT